jgi:hypothetical protein
MLRFFLLAAVLVSLARPASAVQLPDVVALASRGSGNLDVFVRGMDNALWRKGTNEAWFTGDTIGWTKWESWGGKIQYGPGAAVATRRLLVAAVGQDKALWSRWGDPAVTVVVNVHRFVMTPFERGGGQIKSSPSVCARDRENYAAYALGLDNKIWYATWSPGLGLGWSEWRKVDEWNDVVGWGPEIVCGDIGLGTSRPGGVSLNGVAVFTTWNGAVCQLIDQFGNKRRSLGAPPGGVRSTPGVAFDYLGARYLVCVVGGDRRVWCQFGDGPAPFDEKEWNPNNPKVVTWTGKWQSLGGGVVTSAPAAVSTGSGGLAVAVRNANGAVWLRRSPDFGKTWRRWQSLGGRIPT